MINHFPSTPKNIITKSICLINIKIIFANFFRIYTEWMENSSSNKSLEERWIYYESKSKIQEVLIELAPGNREKDGYVLSGKRTGERLKELLLRAEAEYLSE